MNLRIRIWIEIDNIFSLFASGFRKMEFCCGRPLPDPLGLRRPSREMGERRQQKMNQGAWIGVVVSVFVIFFLIARSIVHYVKKSRALKGSARLNDYEIRFLPINKKKKNPHLQYVFAKKGGKVLSINTTQEKPFGKGVIKLSHNPDPSDNRKTFAVKEIHTTDQKEAKRHRNKRKDGWSYGKADIHKMEKWLNK